MEQEQLVARRVEPNQVSEEVAALLAQEQVVGLLQGRMEFGPRALGNRSILADPGHPEMRDRINAMVKKREAFREAFAGFEVARVARFDARRRAKLLQNAGIIRNRLKVDAAVENAKRVLAIRGSHGSFAQWLDAHHPRTKDEWVKLFKKTFVFTGGEITGSFLLSIGYLPGAHDEWCPVYKKIARLRPRWMR